MYSKVSRALVLLAGLSLMSGCIETPAEQNAGLSHGMWVDLTYDFSEETIYWPTAEPFEHDTVSFGQTPGGWFYSAFSFRSAEHGGTHLDAPIHFSAGRQSVDEIPVDRLVGPLVVVDVSANASDNRDYLVKVSDFQTWEAIHGDIPEGAMVLLRTGHGQYWPDPVDYLGTGLRGPDAVPLLHFPGLAPEAAQWLVDNRVIRGIGLDTPSIDYGQSQTFEAHQILAGQNILIFENVAHMDVLPPTGAWLVAAPMKIKGGSGGPLRLLAFLPQQDAM